MPSKTASFTLPFCKENHGSLRTNGSLEATKVPSTGASGCEIQGHLAATSSGHDVSAVRRDNELVIGPTKSKLRWFTRAMGPLWHGNSGRGPIVGINGLPLCDSAEGSLMLSPAGTAANAGYLPSNGSMRKSSCREPVVTSYFE